MGVFNSLLEKRKVQRQEQGKTVGILDRCLIAVTAGGIGAVVGNPADLSLIRLQSDATLPVDQRRNYKHAGDAMV